MRTVSRGRRESKHQEVSSYRPALVALRGGPILGSVLYWVVHCCSIDYLPAMTSSAHETFHGRLGSVYYLYRRFAEINWPGVVARLKTYNCEAFGRGAAASGAAIVRSQAELEQNHSQ
jgi:hypothetical protein